MASEFEEASILEIAAPVPNATAAGPFGSNLVSRDYTETGVPVIRGQNLMSRWVRGDFVFVSPEKAAALRTNTARPGDIVFTQRGTLGQVAMVPDGEFPLYVISQSQMKLSIDSTKADGRYVYYACTSEQFVRQVLDNAVAAGVPHINLGTLRALTIPLPELTEQKRISCLLGALDDRIDLLRQTNAILEAIAQSLFKSWFVDFDPVRAKAEGRAPESMDPNTATLFPSKFEESELGLIPKGWRWSTLGHVTAQKGGVIQTGPFGSQLHASDYQPAGVPVVMPQDLAGRRVSEDRIARVSESEADRLSRHRLKSGDIVFSRRGDVGRHAIVSEREVGWLCGTGCLLVRPADDESISTFVSAALARPESLEWLVRHAVGATMPNLNTKILSALPLVWPCDEVVRAYEALASPLDHRVSANLVQAQSLAQLRDTLLPRLISGKLRLPEAEKAIEEAVA